MIRNTDLAADQRVHPVPVAPVRTGDHVTIEPRLQIPARLHPPAPGRCAAFLVIDDKQRTVRQLKDRIGLAVQVDAMRLTGQPDLVADDLCAKRQQMVAPAQRGLKDLAFQSAALHFP